MLRLICAVRTKHQTIDGVLPYELVDFNHWTPCHYHSLIGHLGSNLTLAEGLKALVCFRFEMLLQFGKRCVSVVNACKVRQVVDHMNHIQLRLPCQGQTIRIIHDRWRQIRKINSYKNDADVDHARPLPSSSAASACWTHAATPWVVSRRTCQASDVTICSL